MNLTLLIFIGIVSGIISAMGMGGGTVLILILSYAIQLDQISLQGINLLYFMPIAIFSIIFHIRNNTIELKTSASIIPFGIIGAILGAQVANYLIGGIYLKKIFGFFVLIIGIYTLFQNVSFDFLRNPDNPAK